MKNPYIHWSYKWIEIKHEFSLLLSRQQRIVKREARETDCLLLVTDKNKQLRCGLRVEYICCCCLCAQHIDIQLPRHYIVRATHCEHTFRKHILLSPKHSNRALNVVRDWSIFFDVIIQIFHSLETITIYIPALWNRYKDICI